MIGGFRAAQVYSVGATILFFGAAYRAAPPAQAQHDL